MQNWAAPLKRLLCSRILKLRACGRSSLKEALGPPSEISFYVFAFTTLPLCWYPLFYAKSKSKFSQLACSDNEVKRTDYFGQNLHGTQICWIWQIIRSDSTGGSIFGASTSSSKSLLLSGADWNTILTPGLCWILHKVIMNLDKPLISGGRYGWSWTERYHREAYHGISCRDLCRKTILVHYGQF